MIYHCTMHNFASCLSRTQLAEESFQQSPLLKELLAKSEQNREKNKKAIADKYCMRQAELGIGRPRISPLLISQHR